MTTFRSTQCFPLSYIYSIYIPTTNSYSILNTFYLAFRFVASLSVRHCGLTLGEMMPFEDVLIFCFVIFLTSGFIYSSECCTRTRLESRSGMDVVVCL